MKLILGSLLAILGAFIAWASGIALVVSVVAWVVSLMGPTLIQGAGVLIFKFAGGWLIGIISTILGASLVTTA